MFKNIILPFILCNFATSTLQNGDYNDIYHIIYVILQPRLCKTEIITTFITLYK